MVAGILEGNLSAHPERARLLEGPPYKVSITAADLSSHAVLVIGEGRALVAGGPPGVAHLAIRADSVILLDLVRAPLIAGLPSAADPRGRKVLWALLAGRLEVRGLLRTGLLRRVQRLLSVA